MRLLVLTPAPTPYRDPFWARVARQPGVELLVCYLAPLSRDRPWQVQWERPFPYRELPGVNLLGWRGPTEVCYWNPEVRKLIRPDRCDALILGGYNHLTLWVAMIMAGRRRIPFFMMSESHLKNPRPGWKLAAKKPFVRWIVRHATGLFPTGVFAREYFQHYGASPQRMALIPNVPDVKTMGERIVKDLPNRDSLRGAFGLAEKKVILYAGRLIPKKGVQTLIDACSRLPRDIPWELAILGEGTYRPTLQALAQERRCGDRVRFAGFIQPEELPNWYLMADLFVLPSSETWGVVALEALSSGLPTILSDQTGCWPDALPPELHKRRVFPFGDAEALARCLRETLPEEHDRLKAIESWADFAQRFHYEELARQLVEFVGNHLGIRKNRTPLACTSR